jgi:hypothetical protein
MHLLLTLQLLAPAQDAPQLHLRDDIPQLSWRATRTAEQVSGATGVLAAQASAVGMAAVWGLAAGDRGFNPLRPSSAQGFGFVASELVLAPLGAALGVYLANGSPDFGLEAAFEGTAKARGVEGALLAAYEVLAAAAGSQLAALVGLVAMFVADYGILPAFAAANLHEALAPAGVLPGPPPADAPPRAALLTF